MELKTLQKHVRTLVTLEETEAPVISCYLNLESGVSGYRDALDERIRLLQASLKDDKRRYFEEALDRIEAFIATELLPDAKGAAVFSRGGDKPFFLPLQFRVPLPNWFALNPTPNIYHLVELKDTYHRFVVMISTQSDARIMGVNLGSVTEQVWKERPELRERIGREWTKEHYHDHRQKRGRQFVKDKIKILDRLMSAGGYTHLILSGDPQMTSRVRNALPKHLAAKLVDIVVASGRDRISDVVAATLAAFVEQEERESQAMVDRLQHELNTSGLAVIGPDASLSALKWKQANVLVLAKSYNPDPGWSCTECDAIGSNRAIHEVCPECGSKELGDLDIKEEMVRVAEKSGCRVEIVDKSEFLMNVGGVGCLLRYLMPEQP
jgi:protein required for attachment to host cells